MRVYLFIILAAALFTNTSCVSNYVVGTHTYKTSSSQFQGHYTASGQEIPKANLALNVKSNLVPSIEEVTLDNSHLKTKTITAENEGQVLDYTCYAVIDVAKTYLGTPYRYGGTTRRGIDCSAFTQSVFRSQNIEIPRVARNQATMGTYVPKTEVRKGDLLFFITSGRSISHVGIVESVEPDGEIKFIHASSSRGVTISSLSESYWSSKYKYAKRVI